MGRRSINELKARFATADLPTQKDFADLIDTMLAEIQASSSNPLPGGAYYYSTGVLTGDTYIASYSPSVTAYNDGTILAFKASDYNAITPTKFDAGNGALEIVSSNGLTLEVGDIRQNQIVEVRFNGSTSNWNMTSSISRRGKAGDIIMSASPLTPDDSLLPCNGASYLRTAYPGLFARINTTYGSADGTHFNVPDARELFPVAVGSIGGRTAIALGDIGGEEKHVLSIAELALHKHFTVNSDAIAVVGSPAVSVNKSTAYLAGAGENINPEYELSGSSTVPSFAPSSPTGTNTAHQNMPPFIGLYFYILT